MSAGGAAVASACDMLTLTASAPARGLRAAGLIFLSIREGRRRLKTRMPATSAGMTNLEPSTRTQLFRRDARGAALGRDDIIHRRLHAAFLVRNAGNGQRHLGGR